jgi:hypothetical protein
MYLPAQATLEEIAGIAGEGVEVEVLRLLLEREGEREMRERGEEVGGMDGRNARAIACFWEKEEKGKGREVSSLREVV